MMRVQTTASGTSGLRQWARGKAVFPQSDLQCRELGPGCREGQHWKGTPRPDKMTSQVKREF